MTPERDGGVAEEPRKVKRKIWHLIAAKELRGKLWKLQNRKVFTLKTYSQLDEDTIDHIITCIIRDVELYFDEHAAQIIAECEADND